MTLEEYQRRLRAVVQEVEQRHPDIMLALAFDALAKIKDRVQQRGEDATGAKYSPYSTRPTLAGRRSFLNKKGFDKIAGSPQKRRALQWRTVRGRRLFVVPGGYKQIRDLSGLQTKHKDFTFTGQMWRETQPRLMSPKTAMIKPRTDRSVKAMNGLMARGYVLLDLSEQERRELLTTYDTRVMQIFRKNGL